MKSIILCIFCLLFCQITLGQNSSYEIQEKKPKIGLVLSGGGAKGLAHIGVLKVIDSLGIQIDYIGGTSMGSIIGGVYAAGYSGKQLDSIFGKVNANALIQDFTPRTSKSFYEKRNDEVYFLTLPFDKFKIGLPRAYSKGLYNYNLLSRLTLPVSHITDFSKLPIPFFCVATDMETGKEVILDKGNLPQAQIASSAIPSVFNPVEIDGKLLVDGGVVNNYPVEHMRQLGADVIIGVDVQDGLKGREQLRGATELLSQVSSFSMIEKMEIKRQQTDIYIKPDITGYTVVSFEQGQKIIPRGVEATLAQLDKLKPLQSNFERTNIITSVQDSIHIESIEIQGHQNFTRSYIIGKLRFRPGNKITQSKFERGINNLNATQNFSSIFYSFKNTDNNAKKLILYVKEKKSNMFLRFGAHYDELFKSSVLLNFTKKRVLTKNDVIAADFILGDNIRYNFNYYIDNGFYWSFGVNSKYLAFNRNVPNDFGSGVPLISLGVHSINIDYSDLTNQAYFQTLFAQTFSLGIGAELKHLKISSNTLSNVRPVFEKSDYFSVYGYVRYDSFNQKYFPKKGWYFNGEFKSVLHSSDYNNNFERFNYVKGDIGIAHTFFDQFTIILRNEAGFHIGENTTDYFDFTLGGYGFTPINNTAYFYGYDFLGLIGDSYIKGQFTVDVEIFKKNHLNFSGNFAHVGYKIFETPKGWLSKPAYTGYALGYGIESIIGPLEIKHSWSPETRKNYTWFSIGYRF